MKYLLIALLLIGCSGSNATESDFKFTPTKITKEYIDSSTYWCLPQYFNGVPKYCAYGTYTHKHIPLAYYADDTIYHVYTDNTKDDNFYIYAAKGNEEKVLVHTIENWSDPHSNASIHVLQSGIVHIHVAARGIGNSFQSGSVLASKTPYELDFECIDGCNNFEGYPQVWETTWGEHVNYSHNIFEYDLHPKQWMRSPHYRVGNIRKQLVRGGHYYISLYENNTMYVVYNWLIDGHPDNRVNLYVMKTTNGTDWTNLQGEALTLPLVQDSNQTKIFTSAGYTYLKDLKVVNNWLKVLFTESDSADPTKGTRTLKEWSEFKGLNKSYKVEDTGHNYNGAAYIGKHIVTTNSDRNMIGGDIALRDEEGEVF